MWLRPSLTVKNGERRALLHSAARLSLCDVLARRFGESGR